MRRHTPYALPFATPVTTARGTFATRRGWHVWIGEACGDVAPWPGFGAGLAAVRADLDAARPHTPEVRGATATAAAVAEARAAGQPLARLLAPAAAEAVESHVLVHNAATARQTPARALKVKVGAAPLADDVARVGQIRAARPEARLRLDANGAWAGAASFEAVRALAAFEPEWIEQPTDDPEALRQLRAWAPIAADEAVTDAAALEALLAAEAVDVVVLKPAFVGGARAAVELGRRARAAGVGVCVTHALGSAVDRWTAVHVACALAADGPVAAGLGGGPTDPLDPGPQLGADGWVRCPGGPGLGGVRC